MIIDTHIPLNFLNSFNFFNFPKANSFNSIGVFHLAINSTTYQH